MYVRKILLEQVVKLFTDEPKYRDNRIGTTRKIIETHYANVFGKNIEATAKLVFDIDRAFRFVQQHVPALRGKQWLKRQKNSGEISEEDYNKKIAALKAIKKICVQMEMEFE